MTTVANETAAPRSAGGTVFDIGYQRYTGPREGRFHSGFAVFKDGVRTALGLGRGPRAKVLPWFFVAALGSVALIMAAQFPSQSDFYGITSMIYYIFAAAVGPELLCRDRREGVINLYAVRPLTGSDYVLARWCAFLTVMVAAAWLPQLFLMLRLAMNDPTGYLRENWLDIPRFLAAGAAIAAYGTTLALLVASFTSRRAYAAVFLVGLFVVVSPFTTGLASSMDGAAGQWISMFDLGNIPVHVNDVIFGEVNVLMEELETPASELPGPVLVSWFFAWTLVPFGILWLRYRRLKP